eukprot:TRINITY_DN2349_c0_g1_i1.p1 TRINITY_DN2349_c0_g1~~TRINITY_DN2349_c0_g1_i1.p1  ORF type:complete len:278 (-),score=91.21 TRINITY_DN2349_c0_g1_i1:309-1103(-)
MPIIENLQHTFKHSWKDVSLASWLKYPCADRPDVEAVDIAARKYEPGTGILRATRITIINENLPRFITSILGGGFGFMLEHSMVDPRNKRMILSSRNISFSGVVVMEETCVYTEHPENSNWTLLDQHAKVTAFPFGVSGMLESFMSDKFIKNAQKGRGIMDGAIDRVRKEGRHALDYMKEESSEAMRRLTSTGEELSDALRREIRDAGDRLDEAREAWFSKRDRSSVAHAANASEATPPSAASPPPSSSDHAASPSSSSSSSSS